MRIFNTYGPRMKPQRRAGGLELHRPGTRSGEPITIYGDGSQTRSFCYVSDEIAGFLALVDSDVTGPINIGNPGEFTMLELAELVLDVTGSRSKLIFEPLPSDDPKQRRPDITLARSLLGWEPEVSLVDGLKYTVEWFDHEAA